MWRTTACLLLVALALVATTACANRQVAMIGYTHGADYLQGYKLAAEEKGIEYDVLTEEEIGDVLRLSEYPVIVAVTGIGEQVGLPEEARDALVAYLAFGGSVVMEQQALNNIRDLPITPRGTHKAAAMEITDAGHPVTAGLAAGERLDYNGTASRLALAPQAQATVLAEAEGNPALVVAPVARGQLIYSAICLGLTAQGHPDQSHQKLIGQMLDAALAFRPPPAAETDWGPVESLLKRAAWQLRWSARSLRGMSDKPLLPYMSAAEEASRTLALARKRLGEELDLRTLALTMSAAKSALASVREAMIGVSRKHSVPLSRDLYDMRVVNWRYPADLTWEDALSKAAELHSLGVNFLLTEGHRQHMAGPNEGVEATRLLVIACRRFGIRVVHHATCAFIPDAGPDRQDWRQRDLRTGDAVKWSPRRAEWDLFCMNNPDFRREYFRQMASFRKQTGVDGFMIDEVEWLPSWFVCGCPVCRQKFERETGHELPTGEESEHYGNFDDPLWRAWISARMRWVGDFYQDFQRSVLGPRPVWFGCLAGGAEINMPVNWGDELEEFMRSHNIVFWEAYQPHHFYSWLADAPRMAYHTGAARHFDKPALTLLYPVTDDEQMFVWAYAMAYGHRLWSVFGSHTHPLAWGECFNFEREHRDLFYRPESIADTAILFSRQTRDMYFPRERDRFLTEWRGWCQALTGANRPYDVILDGDVTAEGLEQYRLVILPACACLSDEQVAALEGFVREGGNMIMAGEAATRDETGAPREESALSDLISASVREARRVEYQVLSTAFSSIWWLTNWLGGGLETEGLLAEIEVPVEGTPGTAMRRDLVPARLAEDDTQPFLILRRVGEGDVAFVAGRLGAVGDLERLPRKPGEDVVYSDSRQPTAVSAMQGLVERMHRWPWPVQAPTTAKCGALVTATRHQLPGRKTALVIHALNISGTKLDEGQVVPDPADANYPPLGEIRVTLPGSSRTDAYAVSPDFRTEDPDPLAQQYERREVKLSLTEGGIEVIIPEVQRYTTVVLELQR